MLSTAGAPSERLGASRPSVAERAGYSRCSVDHHDSGLLHLLIDGVLELLDSVRLAPVHPDLQCLQTIKSRVDKSGEWGAHDTYVLRRTCPDGVSFKVSAHRSKFLSPNGYHCFAGALVSLLSSKLNLQTFDAVPGTIWSKLTFRRYALCSAEPTLTVSTWWRYKE